MNFALATVAGCCGGSGGAGDRRVFYSSCLLQSQYAYPRFTYNSTTSIVRNYAPFSGHLQMMHQCIRKEALGNAIFET